MNPDEVIEEEPISRTETLWNTTVSIIDLLLIISVGLALISSSLWPNSVSTEDWLILIVVLLLNKRD